MSRIRPLLLAVAVLVGGCSTIDRFNPFTSTSGPKMAELQPFDARAEVSVAWKETVGGAENYVFTPAIVGGSVYSASGRGDVVRVDDGAVRWKLNAGQKLSGGVGTDGRLVVVGSPKGDVIAYDASNGNERWRARVSSDILAAPAVDGGIVVIRSGDNRLFGFDAADGQRKWIYQRATPPLSLRSFAAPLLDGSFVFAGFPGGKLVAVTTNNGASAWEGAVAVPKGTTELDRVADITAAPIVAGRLICGVAFQGRVACFDLGSGQLAWAREMSSSAGLAADSRFVYVSDDKGHVHALDLSTGASVWKQDKLAYRQLSAPAARGRWVAVGDTKGVVHILDRDDGSFAARVTTDGTAISAPIQTLDNKFLLQTRGGTVMAIDVR